MIEYLTSFYLVLGFSALFFGLGFYLGKRGLTGVETDLENIKLDIAHLKGAVSGTAPI